MSDLCYCRFIGRQSVIGSLNDISLSHLVTNLRLVSQENKNADDIPCVLEIRNKHLLINYIKRDEGFCESDGESLKSSTDVESEIKDGVYEDSANSSAGSDSEYSSSTIIPSNLTNYDSTESINIQDVLICHTDSKLSNCIVWVIRNPSNGSLEASVFETSTEENFKDLYKKFHELSKRCKLEKNKSVKRWNLIHRTDDGITHLKVEKESMSQSKSKFEKELESILSKELESRNLESQSSVRSLRQRAPPLLLRKLDDSNWKYMIKEEFESRKIESKYIEESKDRKVLQVPTKTGKEPIRKCYPKDHLLPLRFVQLTSPMQFSTQQQLQHPSSSSSHYTCYSCPPSLLRPPFIVREYKELLRVQNEETFRGRSLETIKGRTKSKSPSFRNGFSKCFKELGDVVKSRITNGRFFGHPVSPELKVLKSNLKKQGVEDVNKKVHFNKFATVQMLE